MPQAAPGLARQTISLRSRQKRSAESTDLISGPANAAAKTKTVKRRDYSSGALSATSNAEENRAEQAGVCQTQRKIVKRSGQSSMQELATFHSSTTRLHAEKCGAGVVRNAPVHSDNFALLPT